MAHETSDAAETETVDGRYGTISYFAHDPVIGRALRRYGEWAENELRYFAGFIPQDGTVLDIGGFIGTHALAFAHMVGSGGLVHTFEPQPRSFKLLETNIAHNSLSQVQAHRAAVGAEPGQLAIEPLDAGIEANFGGLTVGDNGEQAVDVLTIDSLGLASCDFMKCDVEGMEHLVLRGGRDTIGRCRPVIYCEANSLGGATRTMEELQALGYAVFGHVVDAFNPSNFFACADNIFGTAREFGLIAVAQGEEHRVMAVASPFWQVYPIETLDDLAFAMMQKHQYFDEVLRAGAAARTGGRVVSGPDYDSAVAELAEIRAQAFDMLRQLETERTTHASTYDQLVELRDQLGTAGEKLAATEAQLETTRRDLTGRCEDLELQMNTVEVRCRALEKETQVQTEELTSLRRSEAHLGYLLRSSEERAVELDKNLRRIQRSKIYRLFRRLIAKEMKIREGRKKKRARRKAQQMGAPLNVGNLELRSALPSAVAHDPIALDLIGRGLAPTDGGATRPIMIYVTHISPVAPRAGNEYRIARVLDFLRKLGVEPLLLLAPLPGEEPDVAMEARICEAFDNVVIVDRSGRLKTQLSLDSAAAALRELDGSAIPDFSEALGEKGSGSRLLPITRTFSPDLLVALITRLAAKTEPFSIMVNYGFMSRSLPLIGKEVLKIIDTHDVFSTKASKVTRFGIRDSLSLTGAEEASLMRPADVLLAIQPDEARELEALRTGAKVITVGVDMPAPPSDVDVSVGPRLLMVASANDMNRKGLQDFIRFAWPIVLAEIPEATLDVVGSVGRDLSGHEPGVRSLGFVEDLAEVYADCRIVINPAVAGTGLKIKTLEALCHLKPIVLWPSGLDGLHPELAQHCSCATDWYEYAQKVIDLLRDPAMASGLASERARIAHLLSEDFTYAELKRLLEGRLGSERSA